MGDIPHEKALVERFGKDGFTILGVNTDEDKEMYRKKYAEHGLSWRSIFNGTTESGIPKDWGVMGYPTTYLLDHKGVIRARGLRRENLDPMVEQLVKELAAEKSAQAKQ